MHAVDRCLKCHHISKAFYGKTFAQICKEIASSRAFREEWDKAAEKYDILILRDPQAFAEADIKADVKLMKWSGIRMEVRYIFMRLQEFLNRCKYTPKTIFVSRIPPMAKPAQRPGSSDQRRFGKSADTHQKVIGMPSESQRKVDGKSKVSHRKNVEQSSRSHREVIGKSSGCLRNVIGQASGSHWKVIGKSSESQSESLRKIIAKSLGSHK